MHYAMRVFQVVSILTTTGYASEDFNLWSVQAQVVLLALMFIGGSAGSAAGGPKVVRHVLMAKYTLRELRRTLHPRAVLPVKLGGRIVPDETMRAVVVFMLFYILTFAVGAGIVILMGADFVSGISGTAALIGNVGPGFGTVGPMGQLRGPASCQPRRAHARDVDRSSGNSDGPCPVPARSLAYRAVATRLKLPVFARPSRLRDIFRA